MITIQSAKSRIQTPQKRHIVKIKDKKEVMESNELSFHLLKNMIIFVVDLFSIV